MKKFKFSQTKLAALPTNLKKSKATELKYSDTVVIGLKLSDLIFSEFALDLYLPHALANKRSANSDESKLRLHLMPVFGERTLSSITTKAIQEYQNKLLLTLTPATANMHYSLLHRLFALAISVGLLGEKSVRWH